MWFLQGLAPWESGGTGVPCKKECLMKPKGTNRKEKKCRGQYVLGGVLVCEGTSQKEVTITG